MSDTPKSHPRYESLRLRDAIVAGVAKGITSPHGLVAHGRGEALDYLLGERTRPFARRAIGAAAALLLEAQHPVLSVNGNAAALVPDALAALGEALDAPLEVNLFHASRARERALRRHLLDHGAQHVLMPTRRAQLDFIDSNRRFVHPDGLYRADVVFVPLEDGDRCEALRKMGKSVVTVDLNPLSRTARAATITVVDNLVRAMPLLVERVGELSDARPARLRQIAARYDNRKVLADAVRCIRGGAR